MNSIEAREKIGLVANKLSQMKEITSFVSPELFEEDENGTPYLFSGDKMSTSFPDKSDALYECWQEIQKIVPPSFSVDGNLVRHMSFNEAGDWLNISNNDIPREFIKIEEYKKLLSLIEYIENLHPEVSRVSEIALNGDIDAALKTVFATLDARIRTLVKAKVRESTVPMIGKAFKEGLLVFPIPENTESVRNFLQGVIGYYRSNILHKPLSPNRNTLGGSLSLFGLAHEAFNLLDSCRKK